MPSTAEPPGQFSGIPAKVRLLPLEGDGQGFNALSWRRLPATGGRHRQAQ
ncbi:hypothetical protein [Cyanobium sp. PCC 7001]|nr:hypothetical protein [Cyanobium sp. PCC 7001]